MSTQQQTDWWVWCALIVSNVKIVASQHKIQDIICCSARTTNAQYVLGAGSEDCQEFIYTDTVITTHNCQEFIYTDTVITEAWVQVPLHAYFFLHKHY